MDVCTIMLEQTIKESNTATNGRNQHSTPSTQNPTKGFFWWLLKLQRVDKDIMGIFFRTTLGIVCDERDFPLVSTLARSGQFYLTTWQTTDQRSLYVISPNSLNADAIDLMKSTCLKIRQIELTFFALEKVGGIIKILPDLMDDDFSIKLLSN